jgi:membrane protease YdiL (CAAX protease family)
MAGLVVGAAAVFALFHSLATALGSDRGQSGVAIAIVVVAAILAIERLFVPRPVGSAMRAIGFGPPRSAGLAVSAAVSLLLLLIPVVVRAAGVPIGLAPGSAALVPGLFAQAGIAEEALFRGFLFGHFRRGRPFWRAAFLSMLPFVIVHLLMFLTMPWPVALAAVLLAVATSFPLARLYDLGGSTIWAPALLHAVIQGTIKVVTLPDAAATWFPLAWIAASAAVPLLVFVKRVDAGSRGS